MILVISKSDKVVVNTYPEAFEISELSNGYPLIVEANVAFPPEFYALLKGIKDVPENVKMRYCYEESTGFYENPNWTEPTGNLYGLTEEEYQSIKDEVIEEIRQEVMKSVE